MFLVQVGCLVWLKGKAGLAWLRADYFADLEAGEGVEPVGKRPGVVEKGNQTRDLGVQEACAGGLCRWAGGHGKFKVRFDFRLRACCSGIKFGEGFW